MTIKLKCPYSEEELKEIRNNFKGNKPVCPVCPWCNQPKVLQDDIFVCANTDCSACAESFLHKALIQAKQDLEFFIEENDKSATALIERTKELNECKKDLKIARKALEGLIAYYDHYDNFDCEISWDGVALIMRNDAHEALEQIKHKEK